MIREMQADIVIVGGGLGGCSAALAAAKMGKRVVVSEETDWLGGQLTSQAVPPDENRWIETFGGTRSYRKLREGIRNYYRKHFPLTPEARSNAFLNPGNGSVSRLCCEPRAALAALHELLAPYIHSGRITVLHRCAPTSAETDGDRVRSVTVRQRESGTEYVLSAPYFLDATECGDVLPLAGAEYTTGSESQKETGEPHALSGDADPSDMQAITFVFALDYFEGEDHTIDKPEQYDFWKAYQADFWPARQLSWFAPRIPDLSPMEYSLFQRPGYFSLWNYRRIIDRSQFAEGTFPGDISLINWPQNDYWLGPIIDVSEETRERHLHQAKQLSLSLLYWMQKEAPRPDGGAGFPGLRLRPDVTGTEDGFAMYPYIRESRRIKAEFTVLEQHISAAARKDGAEPYHDSVGTGSYRIDLHPSTGNRTIIDISSHPFQIPLGSLIPIRLDNLLPACKNIGVTHITNGCYRLHPVEWNIGETAGYLAAYCLDKQVLPRVVREQPDLLQQFQHHLLRQGIEIQWPQMVPV